MGKKPEDVPPVPCTADELGALFLIKDPPRVPLAASPGNLVGTPPEPKPKPVSEKTDQSPADHKP